MSIAESATPIGLALSPLAPHSWPTLQALNGSGIAKNATQAFIALGLAHIYMARGRRLGQVRPKWAKHAHRHATSAPPRRITRLPYRNFSQHDSREMGLPKKRLDQRSVKLRARVHALRKIFSLLLCQQHSRSTRKVQLVGTGFQGRYCTG